MRGLLQCAICGRSGGHLRGDGDLCEACRRQYAPTQVQLVLENIGFTEAEVAELAGVSTLTVSRAARGDALGPSAAAKLAAALEVDEELLRRGEPLVVG